MNTYNTKICDVCKEEIQNWQEEFYENKILAHAECIPNYNTVRLINCFFNKLENKKLKFY